MDLKMNSQPDGVVTGVLGGDPGPAVPGPYPVSLARLPAGLRLPRHSHERATLNVVLDGSYGETIDSGRFRTHGPATLIAKPSKTPHENVIASGPVECLVVELDDEAVPRLLVRRSAPIAALAGRLRVELARGPHPGRLVVEGLVTELLGEAAALRPLPADEGNHWLLRARDLLHDEAGLQSLRDVAARLGRHPVYVARAFRARFGCSVGEYSRAVRLESARRLLHNRRLPISSIAARAGYSDQSHMTREFQARFRISPDAYRRLAS
jgi:AraC family transcriptional regulator